jgi:hypothetical protein
LRTASGVDVPTESKAIALKYLFNILKPFALDFVFSELTRTLHQFPLVPPPNTNMNTKSKIDLPVEFVFRRANL